MIGIRARVMVIGLVSGLAMGCAGGPGGGGGGSPGPVVDAQGGEGLAAVEVADA